MYKPIRQMYELRLGHVIEELPKIPAGSVQCVVSSPPYYQMRSYDQTRREDPTIWGGKRETAEYGAEKKAYCESGDCGDCYLCRTVKVFDLLRETLHPTGLVWWNIADKYSDSGTPMLLPLRLADRLSKKGWYLRDLIIWAKQIYEERLENTLGRCVPESVNGWKFAEDGTLQKRRWRTTRSHEYVLMLSKSKNIPYFAMKRNVSLPNYTSGRWSDNIFHPSYGRFAGVHATKGEETKNLPSVWRIDPGEWTGTPLFSNGEDGHIAVMPLKLAQLCVRASTSVEGCCARCRYPVIDGKKTCKCPDADVTPMVVLDPFCGSGTTGVAALKAGCFFIGIDTSQKYLSIARRRLERADTQLDMNAMFVE